MVGWLIDYVLLIHDINIQPLWYCLTLFCTILDELSLDPLFLLLGHQSSTSVCFKYMFCLYCIILSLPLIPISYSSALSIKWSFSKKYYPVLINEYSFTLLQELQISSIIWTKFSFLFFLIFSDHWHIDVLLHKNNFYNIFILLKISSPWILWVGLIYDRITIFINSTLLVPRGVSSVVFCFLRVIFLWFLFQDSVIIIIIIMDYILWLSIICIRFLRRPLHL